MSLSLLRRLWFPTLSLAAMVSCSPKPLNLPASSPEGRDLAFYAEQVTRLHKDAFANTPRSVFTSHAAEAIARLDAAGPDSAGSTSSLDRTWRLFWELKTLGALIGDSHTSINPSPELETHLRSYPWGLASVEGRWVVASVEEPQAGILGQEVIALNGIPLSEVLSRISTLVGFDNEAYLRGQSRQLLTQVDALEFLRVVAPGGELVVTLATGTLSLSPVSQADLANLSFHRLMEKAPITGPSADWYRYLPLGDTLFCQYNRCQEWDSYSLKAFTADVLGEVGRGGYHKVIVDLRYNGGGNSALLGPLIEGLAAARKTQGINLFVLVGERTFSSAIMNAAELVQKAGAVSVGEPTGGSLNHFGEVRGFDLPGSGIEAQYSTKYFVMDAKAPAGSLVPSVIVRPTLDDLRSGVDAVVTYCLATPRE